MVGKKGERGKREMIRAVGQGNNVFALEGVFQIFFEGYLVSSFG